jgi:hypothetical protein
MKASPSPRFIHALQVGSLLGLGVFLWGASLLPIHHPALVCECTALVSSAEHLRLTELSGRSRGTSTSIDWLVCEQISGDFRREGERSLEGEVAAGKVRLRLGLLRRATPMELEQELKELIADSRGDAPEFTPTDRSVARAKWRLQVAEHAMSRFRLDCSRNGVEFSEGGASSPFRLASRSSASPDAEQSKMFESLCRDIEESKRSLELASSESLVADGRSQEIFTVTGTPRFRVRGGEFYRSRASVVLLFAIGSIFAVSAGRNRRSVRKPIVSENAIREAWMRMLARERLPYLGVLATETAEIPGEASTDENRTSGDSTSGSRVRIRAIQRLSVFSRWTDRILVAWLACFALRYVLDPLWRELLFQAPLSAFSCVLFGI